MKESCSNCKYQVAWECRRHPPAAHGLSRWVSVRKTDWCGEWEVSQDSCLSITMASIAENARREQGIAFVGKHIDIIVALAREGKRYVLVEDVSIWYPLAFQHPELGYFQIERDVAHERTRISWDDYTKD